jgi:hypothetical protein
MFPANSRLPQRGPGWLFPGRVCRVFDREWDFPGLDRRFFDQVRGFLDYFRDLCDLSCRFCDLSCRFRDLRCRFCDLICHFCDLSCRFCDLSCRFCDLICHFCDLSCRFCDLSCRFCDLSCRFCDLSCRFCDLICRFRGLVSDFRDLFHGFLGSVRRVLGLVWRFCDRVGGGLAYGRCRVDRHCLPGNFGCPQFIARLVGMKWFHGLAGWEGISAEMEATVSPVINTQRDWSIVRESDNSRAGEFACRWAPSLSDGQWRFSLASEGGCHDAA